jgi:hypothetical protein
MDAMSVSVLQNAASGHVASDPYPYIIIRDALPADLCERLIANYPGLDDLGADASRNNVRWSYPACKVRDNPAISQAWRDVIAYHVSRAFYNEVMDTFAASILNLYPGVFRDETTLREARLGLREADSFDSADILLDAQIAGNTPVSRARSVKPNHIDSHRKLFAGLFYLRRDGDDSTGGDLEIRRFSPAWSGRRRAVCYDGVYVENRCTELVDTVRYEKNVLVLFINSLESLHGVTPRQPTPHARLFMNLVGEVRTPLFRVPRPRRTRVKKLQRQVRKRLVRMAGGEFAEPYR